MRTEKVDADIARMSAWDKTFRMGLQTGSSAIAPHVRKAEGMIYAINYDLRKPGKNYEELYKAIKTLGTWWHHLDSTWLVDTTLNAETVWARLKPHVDSSDFFLIIGVTKDYSGWLPQEAWDWLRDRRGRMAA